jgi:hypothetical protein
MELENRWKSIASRFGSWSVSQEQRETVKSSNRKNDSKQQLRMLKFKAAELEGAVN